MAGAMEGDCNAPNGSPRLVTLFLLGKEATPTLTHPCRALGGCPRMDRTVGNLDYILRGGLLVRCWQDSLVSERVYFTN